jgi:gliding motility-associated-like protein
MKIFTFRNFNVVFFTIALLFYGANVIAQGTPVASINASYVDINDASNDYSINGAGNVATYPTGTTYNLFFSSSTTSDNDYVISPVNSMTVGAVNFSFQAQANVLFIRRVDNAVATGNKEVIWAELESSVGADRTFRPQYLPSLEQSFNSLTLNIGSDEFFVNSTAGSIHYSNIERIDFVFTTGYTSANPANSGFAVFERNGNDNFKIAAITAIDLGGNPTSFGPLVSINQSQFGANLKPVSYVILEKDPDNGDTNFRPSDNGGVQQVRGVYVSLQDLGVAPGQPFYGYAVLPDDAVSTDFTLNPTNTPAATGGMDLLPGGAIFTSDGALTEIVPNTDGDVVADDIDIDDDNDGILDTAEYINLDPFGDEDGDGIPNFRDVVDGGGAGDGSLTDYTDSNGDNVPDAFDADLDGIPNHLDLDSDNDGIPDNIEAQTTTGYLAPAGDADGNGLDDAYESAPGAGEGISPVNSDVLDEPDFLDTDSDNDGATDTFEAAITLTGTIGVNGLDAATDTPGDDYSDPNGNYDNTQTDNFSDIDGDVFQSGGDVDFRDDFNNAGLICGPINILYQTRGNSGNGQAEVYRYNPFIAEYSLVGALQGVGNNSASNSSYSAVTNFVYSSTGGSSIRVFDPSNAFNLVGQINITGNTTNFNQTSFAVEQFVGYVNDNKVVKFDVTGIASYPATVPAIEIDIVPTIGAEPNDFAVIGNFIYGVRGSQLIIINADTGESQIRNLNLIGSTAPPGGSWGAAWQDRDGNFYAFSNGSGNIFRITDIVNTVATTSGNIDFTQVFEADPSGQNDGFGCEIQPNPLDWDGDGVEDSIDLDDDNDGILDTAENQGLDPNADVDGDGIPALLDDDDTNGAIGNTDGRIQPEFDVDGDDIPNQFDLDSDNDGIPDNVEAQSTTGYIPRSGTVDANGVDTAYGDGFDATEVINSDGALINSDTVPDYLDNDSDNDGILDTVEAFGTTTLTGADADFDGIDDAFDTNSDGVLVIDAAQNGLDPTTLPDSDSDLGSGGDVDFRDVNDADGDGVTDDADLDDDNDGILDNDEFAGPNNPFGDEDGDGVPNYIDTTDNGNGGDGSTTDYTDSNGDGVPDAYDSDNDGVPNHLDLDSDNDGLYDAVEAGHGQPQTNGIVNGSVGTDGIPDAVQNAGQENSGAINYTPSDSEAIPDGIPDFLEVDADGDGCFDTFEAGFTDGDVDGALGNSPVTVDNNGVVTSGVDGYTGTTADVTTVNPDADSDGLADNCDDDDDNDGNPDISDPNPLAATAKNDALLVGIGQTASINIVSNDDFIPGAGISLTDTGTGTATGAVILNASTGEFTYTPAPGEEGTTVSVNYQVCNTSVAPQVCDTATIFITVVPDTDGDGISDNADLDDDNDGITDNEELNCSPGNIMDWDTATWTGNPQADPTPGNPNTASTTINGVTFSATSEITAGITNNFVARYASDINGKAGLQVIGRINELDNGEQITYTFTFSQPVTNLNFSIVDIDRSTNVADYPLFQERITANATNNGNPVALNFNSGSAIQNSSLGVFDGISFIPTNPPAPVSDDGDLNFNFLNPVDTITITYSNLTANTDNSQITILFTDFTWDCPSIDSDGDGIANNLDLDSDNDGILDVIESGAGLTDADNDGRVDGAVGSNGIPDAAEDGGVDGAGVVFNPVNSDSDSAPDYVDIDADNDGIVDNIEAQSTAGYLAPSGNDIDGNGVDDTYDANPITPENTDATLTNSDAIPDYLDTDSDGDGESDTIEAYDTDDDGTANTVPAGTDADGDGLDDNFDNYDNTTPDANLNPTNNGQTANNPFPDTDSPGGEPNWREDIFTGITITKTDTVNDGGDGRIDAGDTISYVFTVTNTGNVTLTNVTVTDPLVTVSGGPLASLAPGVSDNTTFTATYTITQADIDNGSFTNRATVSGDDPNNNPVSSLSDDPDDTTDNDSDGDGNPDDETVTTITQSPDITITKTDTVNDGGDGRIDAGDTISYEFTVTNTGNVTLTNVTVTDPLVTVSGGPLASLAPGVSDNTTFTATYTITQADIDNGSFTNRATVSGDDPNNNPVSSLSDDPDDTTDNDSDGDGNPDDETVTTITQSPDITITKTDTVNDGGDGRIDAGDTISYEFTVTNTGNVTLTNVTVTDPLVTVSGGPLASLAPGVSDNTTFTATYTITQADIDNGSFTNRATVSGDDPNNNPVSSLSDDPDDTTDNDSDGDGNPDDETVTTITQSPDITITKTDTVNDGGDGRIDAGDTISYEFTVTNTGNVTLTNVTVTDPLVTVSGGPLASLAPGVSDNTTFTATYTITQADIDNGSFTNRATVSGDDPNNNPVSSLSDDPDDTTDNDSDGDGNPDDETVTTITQSPDITITKTDTVNDGGDGRIDAGDTISYEFTVTNTGNVTLTNVTVTDPLVTVSGGPLASLAPGVSDNTTFTATYTITQADIDNGSFTNRATVSGDDPNNNPVSSLSDDPDDTTDNDSDGDGNPDDETVTTITQSPDITITKTDTVNDGGDGRIDAGDTISYEFTVTNTGNVTLTNVTVTDPLVTVSGGPLASLAPGVSDNTTFTATYTITQADIDNGSFTNRATVSGDDPNNNPVSSLSDDPDDTTDNDSDGDGNPDDETVTTITQSPDITITKTDTVNDGGDGRIDAGDTISYVFTVTNTGNVTLTNVTVTDPLVTVSGGPLASLAPGVSDNTTFTATYTITQADIDNGSFTNRATVSGDDPNNNPVSSLSDDPDDTTDNDSDGDGNPDDETVTTITQSPDITITKTDTVNDGGDGRIDAGDTISYEFTVTNTGNVTLTNVAVTDPLVTVSGGPLASLAPGVSDNTTFTATYTITQADIDNGSFTNRATVSGDDPNNNPVSSLSDDPDDTTDNDSDGDGNPDDETVTTITQSPDITITKTDTVNDGGDGRIDAGDTISYEFTVTNTGNVTLTNVTVTDPLVTVSGGPLASLAPGVSDNTTFTATYTITQEDIENGSFTNRATVSGDDPNNNPVSSLSDDPDDTTDNDSDGDGNPDDETVTTINQVADISLLKRADVLFFRGVRDLPINYEITVVNTGNVILTNIVVTDAAANITGGTPIASLEPGETAIVTAEYQITQADVDNEQFTNVAQVTADSVAGSVSDNSDDPNNDADVDPDGDGDPDDPTVVLLDTDGDNVPNSIDIDDDNDGIVDALEGDGDFDNDGIPDYLDIDSDNDGIPDNIEAQTTAGYIPPSGNDSDNDGLDDAYDTDGSDLGLDPVNTDGEGMPDYVDEDSDNDGVDDIIEANDANFDGFADQVLTGDDTDGDGLDDAFDNEDGHVSNDGITNPSEEYPDFDETEDVNYRDIDDDGDGVDTVYELDPAGDGGDPDDTDNDGDPDYLDIDDDGDGIVTIDENPDPNGDGNPDDAFDTDGDGTPDYLDPNNPTGDGDLTVFQLITPNDDGTNDVLVIGNIQNFPDNTVRIYNRWGVLVFETKGYNPTNNFFDGRSTGRSTVRKGELLPVGTYFYVIDYVANGQNKSKAGYIYINR